MFRVVASGIGGHDQLGSAHAATGGACPFVGRGRILQRLEFLGVILDEDRNRDASVRNDDEYALITTPRSRVEAIVVKTNEELIKSVSEGMQGKIAVMPAHKDLLSEDEIKNALSYVRKTYGLVAE